MGVSLLLCLVALCRGLLVESQWTSTSVSEDNYELVHEVNSFALGISILLLITICLTTYLFKAYEFHYLPEPSVCLISGLLVGAAIRYGHGVTVTPEVSGECLISPPPTSNRVPRFVTVRVNASPYEYRYVGPLGGQQSQDSTSDLLSQKVLFSSELFFYLILPPIIFNCGMRLKKRYFFRNFGAILMMALVGTGLTMFTFSGLIYLYGLFDKGLRSIGLDFAHSLLFGSVICSTDPVSVLSMLTQLGVDMDLYSIILGESALNDAVSLISQRTVNAYLLQLATTDASYYKASSVFRSFGMFFGVLLGSFAIGSLFALATAMVTKASRLRHFPIIETAVFLLLSYCSFLVTEICGMIGIVGILFGGIFQAHYTFRNLSYEAKIHIDKLIELICYFFENFVFCYMGITVFVFRRHVWKAGFIIWSFVSLMLSRAIAVYLLCFLLNLSRGRKIGLPFQHVIFFAGLKGAISFALALENTSTELHRLMLSTTVILVLITMLVFGGLISKIVYFLKIPMQGPTVADLDSDAPFVVNHFLTDETWIARKWHLLNDVYLVPFFTVDGPSYSLIFQNIAQSCSRCLGYKTVVYVPVNDELSTLSRKSQLISSTLELPQDLVGQLGRINPVISSPPAKSPSSSSFPETI